jgi:BirA family biotin operon repressor/biotin-[acetyl-CoA-carboxylase] ligase
MAAVIHVLAPCGVELGMKWPNDLVAFRRGGEGKKKLAKIGGIIGESNGGNIVLGLGLNLFSAPEIPERAIPPASLSSIGAANIPEIPELARRILLEWQNLDREPACAPAFRWPEQGDAIRWEDGQGVCQGWEHDGRLSVMSDSGLVMLASADVAGVEAD